MEVLKAAGEHKGCAFVEIYQNCVIFNDNAFLDVSDKQIRDERSIKLVEGQPLIFGKERNRGIRMRGTEMEVVTFDPASPPDDLLVHHATKDDTVYAHLLARMEEVPELPIPLGVFRAIEKPTYDQMLDSQVEAAIQKKGKGDINQLLNTGDTWTVGK
ncbi:MAG: 2-oxoacid:ferredoxin oxidoreductase subunit beta, partial [bacterium]|nr:2-oxoacid:ferredoxin oxidoreductase subunit beta [bacterium]